MTVSKKDKGVAGPEKLKKLNSIADAYIADEVRPKGRSDVGNINKTKTTTANQKKKKRSDKKEKLLANPDIKRWYDNLARSSVQTADVRVRRLQNFCEAHGMTPLEFAELAQRDLKTAMDLIEDHITLMEGHGSAPQYIKAMLTAVKSWLRHFDLQVTRKFRITNEDSTPTLVGERVPEAQEMSEILNRSPLRAATAISLMAKSGLRPQVLGNFNGTDGLTMKDLPDIVIQQGVVRCLQSPAMVVVRKNLSKTRNQYFTFLTNSGTKKLAAYLNDRLAKGEALNGDSPVIAPRSDYKYGRQRNTGKRFLPSSQVSNIIRDALRPRFQWRPYVFRAYFDTQLLIAESKGKIARDFRAFFMGHKGTIEAKYTTNKGILPKSLTDEMREAFKRSEEFLDLETKNEDPILQQKEKIIDAVTRATPERVQEMLRLLSACNT